MEVKSLSSATHWGLKRRVLQESVSFQVEELELSDKRPATVRVQVKVR